MAGECESEIYKSLGLHYVEPELRENNGEIKAAQNGALASLISDGDIKGDLHCHSRWTDGAGSIEQMAEAGKNRGYEYLAITDHAKALKICRGISEDDIRRQMHEIELLNRKLEDFTVLIGIEANIDAQGRLDISSTVLKDLDVVIASVHSHLYQPEKVYTERILNALHNDYVRILGHPTGRVLLYRPSLHINLHLLFETAKKLGIVLEINTDPGRQDLSGANCFLGRKYGASFSIGSDAHYPTHLGFLPTMGVATARRGWLEKKDIINSLRLNDLLKRLR